MAESLNAMQAAPHPVLVQGSRGALPGMYFAPQPGVAPVGDMLVVPAFAEEMNRCRAMVALQARALSAIGVGTLVVDLSGTGDGPGEFVDATWAQWLDDMRCAIGWLDSQAHGCRGLLGVRLGALMAVELAKAHPQIHHLLFWQPVLNGKTFLTQFLRIRVAAEMHQADRVKTTGELRERSAAGQAIEVSGYEIGAPLALALDTLSLDVRTLAGGAQVDWCEVVTDGEPKLGPAGIKAVEEGLAAGAAIRTAVVVGPAFWHVHERELAPALIDETLRRVSTWAPRPGVVARAVPPLQMRDLQGEFPLVVNCGEHRLSAQLHRPAGQVRQGVVIVVAGGPQYRAGAHRQFVSLARKLAAQGSLVLRFDLRGMGDSTGHYLGFQHSEPDIRAAVDALLAQAPGLKDIVLIGECESASGILFYAWQDPRVKGSVLINPWVRTDEGRAAVIVNHYYLGRLRSPEFWAKVRSGNFKVGESLASLVGVVRAYLRGKRMFAKASRSDAADDISALPLPVKTAVGLGRFKGRVLLMMSGNDYIAREFDEVTAASRAWDGLLQSDRLQRVDVEGADHTFSKSVWKLAASDAIARWVGQIHS